MNEESSFESRFAGLEDASRILSGDVIALNTTLLVVADLQQRQGDTEREIALAKKRDEKRDERTRRWRWLTGLLIPFLSLVVFLTLLAHVNHLLTQQNVDRYSGCMVRNQASVENQRREESLGHLEPDPRIRKIHLDSATQLAHSTIDCEKYRKD